MELATDVIFPVLSSVNKDLFIYVFVTSRRCEIRYADTAELKFIPCINVRVSSTINFSIKKNLDVQIKDLDTHFPGGEQRFNLKRTLL